jgi:hypothetical protein
MLPLAQPTVMVETSRIEHVADRFIFREAEKAGYLL